MVQGTLQAFANDPSNPFQITPRYLVKSRQVVEPGQAPNCVLNESRLPQTTESYARRAEADLIHDFKETVCAVYEGSFNEQMVLNKPSRNFEFPDGFNMQWNPRIRYYAPELFFQPQVIIPKEVSSNFPRRRTCPGLSLHQLTAHAPPTNNSTIPTPPLSMATPIAHMVINSANACDADLLPSLLSNIVVVGGTSLMVGFVERLHNELTAVAPGVSFPAIRMFPICELKLMLTLIYIPVQDQNYRQWFCGRTKIRCMAWRQHFVVARDFPSTVDIKAGFVLL